MFILSCIISCDHLSHTSFWHLSVHLHLSSYLLITISILSSCHLWWYHKFISSIWLSVLLLSMYLTFYFPFSVYHISIFSILVKWRVSQLLGICAHLRMGHNKLILLVLKQNYKFRMALQLWYNTTLFVSLYSLSPCVICCSHCFISAVTCHAFKCSTSLLYT